MRNAFHWGGWAFALFAAAFAVQPVFGQQPATADLPIFPQAWDTIPFLVRGQQPGAYDQSFFPPEVLTPLPTTNNPADGGPFVFGEYVMYRGTNPMKPETLAVRGFQVTAPGGAVNGEPVGAIVGSGVNALDIQQVTGTQYDPGFKLGLGYKFQSGTSFEFSWMYLFNIHKTTAATDAAPGGLLGQELADSFLFSPVYNYPPEYSGPLDKITNNAGNPIAGGAIGIWNGATIETLDYQQRVQQWEFLFRIPMYECPDDRVSGLVGGRFVWIWEQLRWLAIDLDTSGNGGGANTGIYEDVVGNRMYGPSAQISWEHFFGDTGNAGGFAVELDLGGAGLLDIVKERAEYSFGLRFQGPSSKNARTDYTLVPELTGDLSLMWYPVQGIQCRLGYNAMAFFNTVGSQNPVNFDFSDPNVKYNRIFRLYDGLDVGISFNF